MSEVKTKRRFKKNEIIMIALLATLLYGAVVIKMLILPEIKNVNDSKERQSAVTQSFNHVSEQLEQLDSLKSREKEIRKNLLFEGSKIPPVLDRERILLSMSSYSKKSNVTIDGYSFSGNQVFPFEGFVVGPGGANAALDPKAVTPDAEVMIVSAVNMSFRSYEEGLYTFLKTFEMSEPSLYLKSCSVQVDEASGELKATATMEYLAYKGKLAEYHSLVDLKMPKGKNYVFPSAIEIMINNKKIEEQKLKDEMDLMDNLPSTEDTSSDDNF